MPTASPAARATLTAALVCMGCVLARSAGAGDGRELPVYRIPNLPESGEAYYAPDGVHLIAQVKDPAAE